MARKSRSQARPRPAPARNPKASSSSASGSPRLGDSVKRGARRLAALASTFAKRVTSKARPPRAAKTSVRTSAPAKPGEKAAPLAPIARRSVVRKPPREPSVRVRPAERRKSKRVPKAQASPRREALAALQRAASVAAPESSSPVPLEGPAASALHTSSVSPEAQYSLPAGYHETRIVLMVKDPWWLYAYWEVQPQVERAVRGQLPPEEVIGLHSVLRVYDVTETAFPDAPAHRSFDIPLSGLATSWYLHTNAPNRSFVVEVGLLTRSGRFLLLARSNRITAPRAGPSEIIDESWAIDDDTFWRLFGVAAGGGSSPSRWMQAPSSAHAWLSSGSAAGRQAAVQGFWCRVNTDLVIHGATEPRASVSIQGRPVALRPDGSFTLRLAMPEGTQSLTIDVTSADGSTTRTITPAITLDWAGSLTPGRGSEPPRGSRAPADRQASEGAA